MRRAAAALLTAYAAMPLPAIAAGDKALGAYLAGECVTCHQLSGKAAGSIPPIAAVPEDQFIALMHSYKKRERDNQVMQAIAARLTETEIAALAAFFAGLPAPQK